MHRAERDTVNIPPVEITQIDFDLYQYLLGVDTVRLPSTLNFEWCKPSIEDLINAARLVSTISEEDDVAMREELAGYLADPAYADLHEFLTEFVSTELETRAAGERARSVNVRQQANQLEIVFGPIQHGNYEGVNSYVHNGLLTLFNIHTHPKDALFSPQDYGSLVFDVRSLTTSKRLRKLYGTMVVCPSMQVFALATPATPLVGAGEVQNLLDHTMAEVREEIAIDTDEVITDILDSDIIEMVRMRPDELLLLIKKQRAQLGRGELTPSDSQQQLRDFYLTCGEKGQNFVKTTEKNRAIENRVYHRFLVGIARKLNIQLFTSTNLSNFVAASS